MDVEPFHGSYAGFDGFEPFHDFPGYNEPAPIEAYRWGGVSYGLDLMPEYGYGYPVAAPVEPFAGVPAMPEFGLDLPEPMGWGGQVALAEPVLPAAPAFNGFPGFEAAEFSNRLWDAEFQGLAEDAFAWDTMGYNVAVDPLYPQAGVYGYSALSSPIVEPFFDV